MKRFFLLAFAALALTACNDDSDSAPRFAAENTRIEDGSLTGSNIHFLGTATATSADGAAYVDRQAEFEFAGLDNFTLYMHRTRFDAAMPALEMRLFDQPYIPGTGAAFSFALPSVMPQVKLPNQVGGGYTWTSLEAYTLTEVAGSVEGTVCRVGFTCDVPRLGAYRVEYEGRLLE
ncbi:MAG: lipoprotein [Alistipes sp.]|nr:lipoprotein [Alistipes sp.]